MAKILIAGCGYVGCALSERLTALGHEVWALRRSLSPSSSQAIQLIADLSQPQTLDVLPQDLDFIFYTAAADESSDEAYHRIYVEGLQNLIAVCRNRNIPIQRLFFTSSTAVYHQAQGEWVDEQSPTQPMHFSGKRLLEAEAQLRQSGVPATVVRLGGIYGPGRTRLIAMVRQGQPVAATTQYTNRIHRDDAVGVLAHLMALPSPEELYLGVDDEPARQCDVLQLIAEKLSLPLPPIEERVTASRNGSNKRCSNAKLKSTGYRFHYPTFREGYGSLIEVIRENFQIHPL